MNYLALTFAFLGLFNYPSQEQAHNACYDWARRGKTIEYSILAKVSDWHKGKLVRVERYVDRTAKERYCTQERTTNQYLGFVKPMVSRLPNDATPVQIDAAGNSRGVIRKHFRY